MAAWSNASARLMAVVLKPLEIRCKSNGRAGRGAPVERVLFAELAQQVELVFAQIEGDFHGVSYRVIQGSIFRRKRWAQKNRRWRGG
ncbi:hypothetical protein QZH44_29885 (plasmid) [Pseudomonas corrugata]|uniref:hypothetical protein n=1 Tax=Pseudomonas corrugata TaxID=47879 RepID=UPI003D816BEA